MLLICYLLNGNLLFQQENSISQLFHCFMIINPISNIFRFVPHQHINTLSITTCIIKECFKSMSSFMRSFLLLCYIRNNSFPFFIKSPFLNLDPSSVSKKYSLLFFSRFFTNCMIRGWIGTILFFPEEGFASAFKIFFFKIDLITCHI